jgi:mono/diheme cytochrome c family protein
MRSTFSKTLLAAAGLLLGTSQTLHAQGALPETVEFNRDIRPILSDNCFFCHGPDKNKREADLRLDTEAGLHGAEGHHGAIVAGKPDDSEMIKRILTEDPEQKMPPVHSGKSLSEHDVQLLKRWIEQGGKFEGHWAFLPIRTVGTSGPVPNGIDQLVKNILAEHGMTSSAEADRITLIRRLSFDLIGLPPSEKEVAGFVADQSPEAYENLVDRLLSLRTSANVWQCGGWISCDTQTQ